MLRPTGTATEKTTSTACSGVSPLTRGRAARAVGNDTTVANCAEPPPRPARYCCAVRSGVSALPGAHPSRNGTRASASARALTPRPPLPHAPLHPARNLSASAGEGETSSRSDAERCHSERGAAPNAPLARPAARRPRNLPSPPPSRSPRRDLAATTPPPGLGEGSPAVARNERKGGRGRGLARRTATGSDAPWSHPPARVDLPQSCKLRTPRPERTATRREPPRPPPSRYTYSLSPVSYFLSPIPYRASPIFPPPLYAAPAAA
jgi:hypothetical protein